MLPLVRAAACASASASAACSCLLALLHARCGELSARSWPQRVGLALALRLSLRVALRLLEYARHAQRV